MSTNLAPRQFVGSLVRLDPLLRSHASALAGVGLHPELWALQPKVVATPADMQAYVDGALDDQARGVSLPFAIVHQAGNSVIGSTRFMDIALQHRRLEIGATWPREGHGVFLHPERRMARGQGPARVQTARRRRATKRVRAIHG